MKNRVVSGYRPSGQLHLGHYHGNLKNMIELQESHDCYFFVADWHALTTDYKDTSMIPEYTNEMVIDWLAAGLDPEKCVIYRQSDISPLPELVIYFSMIMPLGRLERCPTYKEQLRELDARVVNTYGFLGYPVLMAADILIVDAELVPVGEDQIPHLELTRDFARRFNVLYGELFPEPQPILSDTPRIPGTDGRKMSKSYGNQILLIDPPEEVMEKVKMMITDPARIHKTDKGHPEVCSVFAVHRVHERGDVEQIAKDCREAGIGCVECKGKLAERIIEDLMDFREKRKDIEGRKDLVEEILDEGKERALPLAEDCLAKVRKAIMHR